MLVAMEKHSHVFVLNGPSSAGKTTLAKALQDTIGASCVVVSIDHFYECLHKDAPNNWLLFSTLTDAILATAVAFASQSFDVVIDTVFEREESLLATQRTLLGLPHSLIAVTCDLEVLEERERERGNRRLGLARDQHDRVLQHATYDLQIDTGIDSVKRCVELVLGQGIRREN